MRTKKEILDRIAELDNSQKKFSWEDPDRAVRAKVTIRAQMKGLYFALGKDFNILED
jgi:hypothetical protein